jgi:ribosomal protein S18 acetylase RimI-like enzyme
MEWAEKTARQSIDRVPDGARFSMASGTVTTYQPSIDLLTNSGMKRTRSFYTMEIDLDHEIEAPVLSEGISIRFMTGPEELATIVHAVEDSFQDHYGYVANSFETEMAFWSHMINTAPSFDPTLWFLAMDGDKIAGLSLCWPKRGPNEDLGWVGTLGVLRPWRRQGLGLALLQHSFAELKSRGKKAVGLGVDADSLTGATRLYEKAGMHVTRQFDTYEKEFRPGVDLMKRTAEE